MHCRQRETRKTGEPGFGQAQAQAQAPGLAMAPSAEVRDERGPATPACCPQPILSQLLSGGGRGCILVVSHLPSRDIRESLLARCTHHAIPHLVLPIISWFFIIFLFLSSSGFLTPSHSLYIFQQRNSIQPGPPSGAQPNHGQLRTIELAPAGGRPRDHLLRCRRGVPHAQEVRAHHHMGQVGARRCGEGHGAGQRQVPSTDAGDRPGRPRRGPHPQQDALQHNSTFPRYDKPRGGMVWQVGRSND